MKGDKIIITYVLNHRSFWLKMTGINGFFNGHMTAGHFKKK